MLRAFSYVVAWIWFAVIILAGMDPTWILGPIFYLLSSLVDDVQEIREAVQLGELQKIAERKGT